MPNTSQMPDKLPAVDQNH